MVHTGQVVLVIEIENLEQLLCQGSCAVRLIRLIDSTKDVQEAAGCMDVKPGKKI